VLELERGFSLAQVDYSGEYRAASRGRQVELTLKNVRYPTQISLRLTSRYCRLTYFPNGGTGESFSMDYDTTRHLRPNSCNARVGFAREGYTLTGWNTRPDGSGERVGLGSRVTVPENELELYAQWSRWSDEGDFTYTAGEGVTLTGYRGGEGVLVIPERIGGQEVTRIAAGAFVGGRFRAVILPKSIQVVEPGAFQDCAVEELTLFDNIQSIGDGCFVDCGQLRTLHINAIEPPYGYAYEKESCYADKVDLLLRDQGKKKIVFYGGCSTWFNLDGPQAAHTLGDKYCVINMGLNGTVSSEVQLQILEHFLEPGDVLFHTPELSSGRQMLQVLHMNEYDERLWCGLENNYDLFALVDLRTISGALDSLCGYLSLKKPGSDYAQVYTNEDGEPFCDQWGCVPFYRGETQRVLPDAVRLNPEEIDSSAMERLEAHYDRLQSQGVRVYLSYACVNLDAVAPEQRGNVARMDQRFRQAVEGMDGPVLISRLEDYLYHNGDFYDTNYHLLTQAAQANTRLWLRDLLVQLEKDGLWEAEG